ncbi:enoyl-CoA hydratase-related protein, partial [Acinetobacter baumannii]
RGRPHGPAAAGEGGGGAHRGGLIEPGHVEIAEPHIALVTLNRPEARNGIDMAVTEDLLEVATRCANDPALRAVLFKANGPAFTTGGDLAY